MTEKKNNLMFTTIFLYHNYIGYMATYYRMNAILYMSIYFSVDPIFQSLWFIS